MNHTLALPLFAILLASQLTSCIPENCESCNKTIKDSTLLCVSFSGDYTLTKSVSAIPAGVQTSIFAYSSGSNPKIQSSYPGTPLEAISDVNGNLSICSGNRLFVPPGTYDFYAISTNEPTISGLTIKNGVSNSLDNCVDYLWAASKERSVEQNTNVILQFAHRVATICLTITPEDLANDLAIKSMKVRLPLSGSSMNISTGIISAARVLDTAMTQMSLKENTGTCLMLPLISGTDLPVEICIDAIIYRASIPAPAKGFEGGFRYKYIASVGLSGITFLNASLEEWKEQILTTINL
ncbi:MAG: fimbrillin family protein [Bacteroidales bacterium]